MKHCGMNRTKVFIVLVIFAGILAGGYLFILGKQPKSNGIVNKDQRSPSVSQPLDTGIKIVADNLKTPWELAFLKDNEILVTERPGTLILIKQGQKIPISGVKASGEGGLLGLAIHPNFETNRWIYLYLTTGTDGRLTNKVERYRFKDGQLSERTVIIQGIGGASNHDGGRIAFGPDGNLYITTGDAGNPNTAQDQTSLNGKILRVKDDGSIPTDNPFGNAVYSYGHRNPQGLAWDDNGKLWSTEHGRSGVLTGLDELNLIEKGKNYGWPLISGDETRAGMTRPVVHSGPDTTWAPSGAAFYNGSIYFSGLRGQAIYEYKITDKSLNAYFKDKLGRIRTVVLGPDKYLYILTSNTDGRGTLQEGDDKLIRIDPNIL
ncbi:MAG: Quinoprotein glucose dehydrogenase [Microgenomates group bacterium GW2011_GWB1_44_8]|nr:MAG: Quinoprotein glucose dehydrogenase [Microgenomates group bacterium GW2011_GWB1_44_8]